MESGAHRTWMRRMHILRPLGRMCYAQALGKKCFQRLINEFILTIAKQRFCLSTHQDDRAYRVDDDQRIWRQIKQSSQAAPCNRGKYRLRGTLWPCRAFPKHSAL